ncbi:MAG: hypothetical protein HY221_01780 [Candidatus Sungbacteria bacterium]|uniref:Uncharacterized protein n=1 Tax=Candidatus Sungiibacteriota bacterium TaxID=2750080 RepID=A0A932R1M6_9BACT|nr:hypothetical protein [Candidatus Sungbacteria bacterium]
MKKIIISLGTILFVILLIISARQLKNRNQETANEGKNQQIKNNANQKERIPYQARAEQEYITNREAAIRDFYDFSDDPLFKRAIIDGRKFFLVGYDHGYLPSTDTPTWGGVLIFEQTSEGKFNLFWESSKEYIVHAEGGYSRFQDLTNDGIPEIVVQDIPGASGSNIAYTIYTWRDKTFKVMIPTEPFGKGTATKVGGQIKDIDGDKIMEIIDGYIDEKNMLHQEIYKYNGTEYYLWKKEIKKANQ